MYNGRLFGCLTVAVLVLIISLTSVPSAVFFANQEGPSVNAFPDDPEMKGKRWDLEGISLVYLEGSFYDMGYQQGILLREEIAINMRAFRHYYEHDQILYEDLIELWRIQAPYVSQEAKDFIQGTADALGISFEEVAGVWMAEGVAYSRCCSMAAWGSATADGNLIHLRSMEFPLNIRDPVTGRYVQNSPVIVVANPESEYAFMYPSFAGYVVEDGVNEMGVAVANMWSPNNDHNPYGAPMGLRLFEALYSASTAEEAVDIITTNRTFGYNFIVSDSNTPIGYAVETTARYVYAGTWNDPVESIEPFWAIENVVRRSNCYLSPLTAGMQREHYSPRHPEYVLGLLQGEPWFYIWSHYKALSNAIERHWGRMTPANTMDMLRDVYEGQYNLVWRAILAAGAKETWWQWVTTPRTGEMLISFANGNQNAHNMNIHHIDLLNILKNKSPF